MRCASRCASRPFRRQGETPTTSRNKDVKRVVSALIMNKAEDAAIDFARKTDAEVQTGALISLRGQISGVTNQQHFVSKAGRLAGVVVPEASAGQSSADWLEKQTQAAGQTFKKLEIYSQLGEPSAWKAYYRTAGPNGAFDLKLTDPVKNGLQTYKTK